MRSLKVTNLDFFFNAFYTSECVFDIAVRRPSATHGVKTQAAQLCLRFRDHPPSSWFIRKSSIGVQVFRSADLLAVMRFEGWICWFIIYTFFKAAAWTSPQRNIFRVGRGWPCMWLTCVLYISAFTHSYTNIHVHPNKNYFCFPIFFFATWLHIIVIYSYLMCCVCLQGTK